MRAVFYQTHRRVYAPYIDTSQCFRYQEQKSPFFWAAASAGKACKPISSCWVNRELEYRSHIARPTMFAYQRVQRRWSLGIYSMGRPSNGQGARVNQRSAGNATVRSSAALDYWFWIYWYRLTRTRDCVFERKTNTRRRRCVWSTKYKIGGLRQVRARSGAWENLGVFFPISKCKREISETTII